MPSKKATRACNNIYNAAAGHGAVFAPSQRVPLDKLFCDLDDHQQQRFAQDLHMRVFAVMQQLHLLPELCAAIDETRALVEEELEANGVEAVKTADSSKMLHRSHIERMCPGDVAVVFFPDIFPTFANPLRRRSKEGITQAEIAECSCACYVNFVLQSAMFAEVVGSLTPERLLQCAVVHVRRADGEMLRARVLDPTVRPRALLRKDVCEVGLLSPRARACERA